MKRILAAALAVTLMTGSVLAEAGDRDGERSRDSRHERAHRDHDRKAVKHHRDARVSQRHDHNRHWDDRRDHRRAIAARQHARFHAGLYHRPAGYRHQAWHRGAHLPRAYYAPRYVVNDYNTYHLHRPPHGHHWVRVDRDVVLTAIATGVVVAVVSDLFH